MKIKNGLIFTKDAKFEKKDLYFEGERFVEYSDEDDVIDATDKYVVYGLTDIHFHGAVGCDMCDDTEDCLDKIQKYEASIGVTQIYPATLTLPKEKLNSIFSKSWDRASNIGAEFKGIHMEGPYVSPKKLGAQNPDFVQNANYVEFKEYQKNSNNVIKIVSMAPEMPMALDFIKKAKDEVIVSVAHTTVDYNLAMCAFNSGAKHVTHTFNAMPSLLHREPGPIAAAFDNEDVKMELITDGIHVHPAMIRVAFQLFGDDRIILVSDSMRATGLGDGVYDLGGQKVNVTGRLAMIEGVSIAGSVTNLMDCVRFAIDNGIKKESAFKAASINPCKHMGIFDEYGSLDCGKYANFIILDKDLNLCEVYIRGKKFEY